jgi:hypothetical protein
MDPKKVANNILEFMFDPTKIPVQQRLYFRPEETLRNESFEAAKADAYKAYGEERHNSDFYPTRNKMQKEAVLMDRKTLIASMDVLSQQFNESDPIGKDLRTMAYAVSKMSDDELGTRTVEAKKMEMIKCPTCGGKVMAQTGYCLHCKKKIKDMKKKAGEEVVKDFWSKEASKAVQQAILSDVYAGCDDAVKEDEKEPVEKEEEKAAAKKAPEEKEPEEKAAAKKEPEEKVVPEEKEPEEKAAPEEKEPEVLAKKEEEVKEEEKEAAKKVDEKEEVEAAKKDKKEEEVDTTMLAYDGIEMGNGIAGLISTDDIGELTASEKEKLDMLFK